MKSKTAVEQPPAVPPNSLVASAARLSAKSGVIDFAKLTKGHGWHQQAWEMYRCIGEFRFSVDWVGSMLSKAIIFPTQEVAGERTRLTEGTAFEIIDELFGDSDGKAEMLRQLGIHMTVTGDCWIVGYEDPDEFGDGGDVWQVVASTGLKKTVGGKYSINNITLEVEPENVLAFRVWRPDPQDPLISISPTLAVLPILGEIYKLTQHVAAQVDSRLAGAGILLMPSEMTFPPPPNMEGAEQRTANNAADLMSIIQTAMASSIKNRDDASALVPIVITAPAEAIAAVQHITFWSELDENAIELRNEAIRRLALGMDMPPEVLTGSGDSNHWAAWQADESAIKSHTEPLLKMITTALAKGYLRPALKDQGESNLRGFSIGADTSEMRLRPNRSKEAMELYNLGELSGKALLRETGFDDTDKMGEEEFATWLTRKVASGSTTPELVEAALEKLGVKLEKAIVAPAEETQEARPAPSLKDHPVQDIPDRDLGERRRQARDAGNVPSADRERRVAAASLISASEQVVIRALERAGNKLKSKMGGLKVNCAAAELYQFASGDNEVLLEDGFAQVPTLAERFGLDEDWLGKTLYGYCDELMKSQQKHEFQRFAGYMVRSLEVGGQTVAVPELEAVA